MAAVKVREPGRLAREIHAVRDKTGYASELKFSEITRSTVPVYGEIIKALHESDATLAATVVRGDIHTFDRPGLLDGRDSRVNIRTYRGTRPTARPALTVVKARPFAG